MLPKTNPKLILASASPRRLQLLEQIGIKPDIVAPMAIDETWPGGETPACHAARLANEKAEAAAKRHEGNFILAADTVVARGNRVLGKPENAAEEEAFLQLLSGARHRVITSVTVLAPGGTRGQKTVMTAVSFKRLSDDEMSWYLKSGEWKDKAGGYAIQGLAGAFVKAITGSYSNVVGLPLYETRALLAGLGYKGGV